MSYPVLDDRRMPYDNNGTVVLQGVGGVISGVMSESSLQELNDSDLTQWLAFNNVRNFWFFFPELTVVTEMFCLTGHGDYYHFYVYGSSDTTNGVDGTWEEATFPNGSPDHDAYTSLHSDDWRNLVKPVEFLESKRVVRFDIHGAGGIGVGQSALYTIHMYGHKDTGESPDDIIFIDNQGTGLEWSADPDWQEIPWGDSVIKQFKVKNTSSTKVANNLVFSCVDADFSISPDNNSYGSSFDLTNLNANTESSAYYVKCAPSLSSLPGPHAARITVTVGSWT